MSQPSERTGIHLRELTIAAEKFGLLFTEFVGALSPRSSRESDFFRIRIVLGEVRDRDLLARLRVKKGVSIRASSVSRRGRAYLNILSSDIDPERSSDIAIIDVNSSRHNVKTLADVIRKSSPLELDDT